MKFNKVEKYLAYFMKYYPAKSEQFDNSPWKIYLDMYVCLKERMKFFINCKAVNIMLV